jgi:hypothetical protein
MCLSQLLRQVGAKSYTLNFPPCVCVLYVDNRYEICISLLYVVHLMTCNLKFDGGGHIDISWLDFPYKAPTLCCHVLSTAPSFMLWLSKLEILFVPLHRSIYFRGGLRCRPILKEHSLYKAERTRKAVYNVRVYPSK